jgi:phage major head subunit gpT-like protein
MKSFIRQEEMGISMKLKASGSDFEFDNDAWQVGIDSWRTVAYGYWQNACFVTMT